MLRRHKVQLFGTSYLILALTLPTYVCVMMPRPLLWLFVVLGCVFLLACVGLVLTPAGGWKIRGENLYKHKPYAIWLLTIIWIEVGISAVFLVQRYLLLADLHIAADPSSVIFKLHGLQFLVDNFGLFPWVLLAFVGARFAYLSAQRHAYSPFSSVFFPRKRSFLPQICRRTIDIYIQLSTRLFLVVNVLFMALQLIYLFDPSPRLFHPMNGIFASAILVIAFQKKWLVRPRTKLWHLKFLHQGMQLLRMFVAVVLVMVFVLLIDYFMFHASPDLLTHEASATLLNVADPLLFFRLWNWSWWVLGVPLIASLLVRVSNGRSVRGFVVGVLLLPVVLWILYGVIGHDSFPVVLQGMSHVHGLYVEWFVAFCFLASMLCSFQAPRYLWFGFYPVQTPKKKREAELKQFWFATAALLGLMCIVGTPVLQILMIIIALPCLLGCCLLFFGSYRKSNATKY